MTVTETITAIILRPATAISSTTKIRAKESAGHRDQSPPLHQLHCDTVFFYIILLISVNIKYLLTINIMSMPSLLSYLPVLSPPFPQGWILRIYPPLHGAMVSALSYLPLLSPPFPPSCSVEPSACTRHVTRAQGAIFSPEIHILPRQNVEQYPPLTAGLTSTTAGHAPSLWSGHVLSTLNIYS